MGLGLSGYVPIVLYVLAIIMVIVALFHKPEYALFFLIPMLPLQILLDKMRDFPMGKDIVDILFLSIFIGCVARRASAGKRLITKTSLNLPIYFLIFTTFISTMRGINTLGVGYNSDILENWKNFIMLPILYLVVVSTVKEYKYIKALTIVILITMIPMDFYFYKTFQWFRQWHYTHDQRISGVFSYLGPNELAAFYAQYSLVALCLFLFDKVKIRRVLYSVVLAANIYCLIFLFSRSAYMAMALGVIIIGLIFKRRYLIVFLLALACLTALAPVSVRERVSSTENEEGQLDDSSRSRFELWKFGLKVFQDHPILGAGQHVYNLSAKEIDRLGRTRDPHNMYIKFMAEGGLSALFIYLLLYYLSLKSAWQLYRMSTDEWLKGFGLGFFTCIIANMFMNVFHDAYSYLNVMGFYWTFLGLIARANIIREENSNPAEDENSVTLIRGGSASV